ncbi:MAG TPA: hypothetical protein PLJ21_07425 [Pseudobdellovibrionaceae bacterium]|nr:hypothetical protein [Pseudobdellovibrionaceae bacterium]
MNQKGQFVIESILLAVLTLGIFMFVTKQLQESQFLSRLISEPWGYIAGMSEAGVWETPDKAKSMHPNLASRTGQNRNLSLEPEL